jgi:hypothetical protein
MAVAGQVDSAKEVERAAGDGRQTFHTTLRFAARNIDGDRSGEEK